MKFQYFKSNKNGQWYFRIRAKNGKVTAPSEGYNNKEDMLKTIGRIRWGALFAKVEEMVEPADQN